MRTDESKAMPKSKHVFIRRNATICKMKPGESLEGTFKGKTTGPWIDPNDGEEKELTRLHFIDDKGEKFIIFEDAGLRNAMANSMVMEGEFIRVEKHEKTTLKNGRTVNQYDIFGIDQKNQ